MTERRTRVTDPAALAALSHPVRLDLLNHLMGSGPATASACARAVGDTPSNCSYHLRTLARHGLVEPVGSADGRERPWRATITGFSVDGEDGAPVGPAANAVITASLELHQRRARGYLAHRDEQPRTWRAADAFSTYGLRLTATELAELTDALDALIRPYIAATRTDAPPRSRLVQLGLQAFPDGAA